MVGGHFLQYTATSSDVSPLALNPATFALNPVTFALNPVPFPCLLFLGCRGSTRMPARCKAHLPPPPIDSSVRLVLVFAALLFCQLHKLCTFSAMRAPTATNLTG